MIRKLFPVLNKLNFGNAFVNIHKWLKPEQQLELHQIATNNAVSKNDRVKMVEKFLNKNANVGKLTHQIKAKYKLKHFAKYLVNVKNQKY